MLNACRKLLRAAQPSEASCQGPKQSCRSDVHLKLLYERRVQVGFIPVGTVSLLLSPIYNPRLAPQGSVASTRQWPKSA